MSEKLVPKMCPFFEDWDYKHGMKSKYCIIERIEDKGDSWKGRCDEGNYVSCEIYSLGMHHLGIPRICPLVNDHLDPTQCSQLPVTKGNGCSYREAHEYLQCSLFSKWYFQQRAK